MPKRVCLDLREASELKNVTKSGKNPIGGGEAVSEVQKIFFFLSSRYNCAIFSAAFKKF